jgi:lipopolysaccharide export system protein LptA
LNSTLRLVLTTCCIGVVPAIASAKSSDRSQPLQVDGSSTSMSQGPNTKSIVSGQVKIVQGTILVTGDTAELYAGPDSRIARVVVLGRKAHIEQQDDKGQLLKADADRVDYDLTTGRAILTGSAQVIKAGSMTITAPKVIYNTDDSTCQAEGNEREDVHVTLLPKSGPAASTPP